MSTIAKPLARLMLRCGIGFTDFADVMKSAFVDVAASEYGVRGRATNISRIAAMTGISRREVRRLRESKSSDTKSPALPSSPVNAIVHFWRYDADFCERAGLPRRLPLEGRVGFTELVRRYGGDVPASALRKELLKAGTVRESSDGKLELIEQFYLSDSLKDSVVKDVAYSLKNLLATVAHNVRVIENNSNSEGGAEIPRLLERCAWTDHLPPTEIEAFVEWATINGRQFIELADSWIGEREVAHENWDGDEYHKVGIGVYLFRDD